MHKLAIVVSLVLFALVSVLSAAEGQKPSTAFFTTDDGKTYFADDITKLPPFEKDGRPAVRAFVFAVENNPNIRFVGYLLQYTPEAKAALREIEQAAGKAPTKEQAAAIAGGTEVKRPGDKDWRKLNDAPDITKITGPDGKPAIPVMP